MPGRSLTPHEEEQLQKAQDNYKSGKYGTNLKKCAREERVSYHTLRRRIQGTSQPHTKAHNGQQYLTEAQEDSVVAWLKYNGATGHATGIQTIRFTAQHISNSLKTNVLFLLVNIHYQMFI
jgi:hypothetical protein